MARTRLYIVILSLGVLSSACAKKAKMRSVPPQAPTAGVRAAQVAPPSMRILKNKVTRFRPRAPPLK